jgi:hypothetical protein
VIRGFGRALTFVGCERPTRRSPQTVTADLSRSGSSSAWTVRSDSNAEACEARSAKAPLEHDRSVYRDDDEGGLSHELEYLRSPVLQSDLAGSVKRRSTDRNPAATLYPPLARA